MKNRVGKFMALCGLALFVGLIWNSGGFAGIFEKLRVYSNVEFEQESFKEIQKLGPSETFDLEIGEYYLFVDGDKATVKDLNLSGAAVKNLFKAKEFSKSKKDKTQLFRKGFHPIIRGCNAKNNRKCPQYDFAKVTNNSGKTLTVLQVEEERVIERNTWLGVLYLIGLFGAAFYLVGGDQLIKMFKKE